MPHRFGSFDSPMRPERVRSSKRRTQALAMRCEGMTFAAIGTALGVSRQAAHKLVSTELEGLAVRGTDEALRLRALESERLDSLLQVAWPKAMSGDVGAINSCVRIISARVRLYGLAPTGPLVQFVANVPPERSPVVEAALRELPPVTEVAGERVLGAPSVRP